MIKTNKKQKQTPCLIIRSDIEEFQSTCYRFQTEPIIKIRKLLKKLCHQNYQKKVVQMVHIMIVLCRNPQKLVKVLKIVDKIINFKQYRPQMQKWITQNYFDIFSRLKQLNKQKQLQQVMIIRKFWLGRIDFELYQLMKTHMLDSFKVNIDCVREDVIPFIKRYYMEILKMDIKTIEYHLPQICSKINHTHLIYQFSTYYPYKDAYKVMVRHCPKKSRIIRNRLIYGAYKVMAKDYENTGQMDKTEERVSKIPSHRRKRLQKEILLPKVTKKFITEQVQQNAKIVTFKAEIRPVPSKKEPQAKQKRLTKQTQRNNPKGKQIIILID